MRNMKVSLLSYPLIYTIDGRSLVQILAIFISIILLCFYLVHEPMPPYANQAYLRPSIVIRIPDLGFLFEGLFSIFMLGPSMYVLLLFAPYIL